MIKRHLLIMFILLFTITFPGEINAYSFNEIEIHGFASTGYIKSEKYNFIFSTENGNFEFSECGVNMTAQMNNNIRIGLQYYAYNMGELGNNNISLDWAFLDYRWKDALGIRVGKIKTPFGLYNEIRDYDMLSTTIFPPQGVYMRYYRDMLIAIQGIDVYGIFSLGKAGRIGYDIFGGTFEFDPDSAFGILNSKVLGWEFDSGTVEYIAGTRVKYYTPINGLLLGINLIKYDYESYYNAYGIRAKTTTSDANAQIYSLEYALGDMTFASEYHLHLFEATNKALNIENETDIEAYYFQLSYRFFERFEASAYYSVYYWDKDDHHGRGRYFFFHETPSYNMWQKDTALSGRFDITNFWLVKFEIHFMNGTALAYLPEDKDYDGRSWIMYALKTTFNF